MYVDIFQKKYVWPRMKTTFSDLNQQRKYRIKFEDVQKKPEFW